MPLVTWIGSLLSVSSSKIVIWIANPYTVRVITDPTKLLFIAECTYANGAIQESSSNVVIPEPDLGYRPWQDFEVKSGAIRLGSPLKKEHTELLRDVKNGKWKCVQNEAGLLSLFHQDYPKPKEGTTHEISIFMCKKT
jgi:hypothetical protein